MINFFFNIPYGQRNSTTTLGKKQQLYLYAVLKYHDFFFFNPQNYNYYQGFTKTLGF